MYKIIKRYLRHLRLFLGKLILDKAPSRLLNSQSSDYKILFIRHDGKIGDFLVSSFVYREIKKQAPNVHIGVVVAAETAPLFAADPYVDSLYITQRRALWPFCQTGLKIAKEKYDVVIDLTESLRNRDILLIRLVNAAVNIGYNKSHFKLFNRNVEPNNQHITYDYCQALHFLGYQVQCRDCQLPRIPTSNTLETFYQTHLAGQPYIAINFFGAANHKKFSVTNQMRWIEKLKTDYPDKKLLVLTCPKMTQSLKENLPQKQFIIYEKTATIFDSIKLMSDACLVISPDTAIVHAAAALNRPLVTFYMSTNPSNPYRKWFPAHVDNQQVSIYYYQQHIDEIEVSQLKLPQL